MLGGADDSNGELPFYIISADTYTIIRTACILRWDGSY